MVQATASIRLPVSIADVWRTYANFGAIQEWSPIVWRSSFT